MSRVHSQRAAALLAALMLAGCAGSGNATPAASRALASPRPVVGARELGVTAASGSFVHDIRYSVGQQTVAAYVVVPRALVLTQPGVDARRVAFVGHDYGSMHGIGLLTSEHRFKGAVLMTADARYVDWFADFWHFIKTDTQRAEYAAQMRPLDPVTVVGSVHGPVLLQFAKSDEFLPASRAQELIAAAPDAGRTVNWYDADHALNDAARTDRDQWLSQLLQLP